MKKRIDVGTDAAMIGAWDTAHDDQPFARMGPIKLSKALEDDARDGRIFLIHTGADGGGPVDVYIDESPPEHLLAQARPVEGEFLLRLPTGRLTVGGAEDYRTHSPRITSAETTVDVPCGDYVVKCWVTNEDESHYASLSECEAAVLSPQDRAYYRAWSRRETWRSLTVFVPLLIFPALLPWLSWKLAMVVTITVMTISAWLLEWQRKRKRTDERWSRINKALQDAWLTGQSPTFILELRCITDANGLKGGSVRLG